MSTLKGKTPQNQYSHLQPGGFQHIRLWLIYFGTLTVLSETPEGISNVLCHIFMGYVKDKEQR